MPRIYIFLITTFMVLLDHVNLHAQSRWVNSYLETQDVFMKDVIESYDKGYLISGKHGPNYSKYNWLIKTDINGEVLWGKTIGNGVNSIALHDLEQDDSGNIYLGGSTKAYDPQGDPLILKLNPCGEKEWCRIFYTEDHHDFSECFTLTPDGDIVAVLLFTNPDPWVERICLAKLSPDGELLWKKCYTSSDTSQRNEDIFDIILTPDAGFLLTGFCHYEDPTVPNKWWLHPYYLKTDSSGNFEWEAVAYKETEQEGGIAWSTVVSPDNNTYYSSFSHYFHEEDFSSPSLLKMDLTGNIISIHDIVNGYKEGKLSFAQFINDSTLAAEAAWSNTDDSLWSKAVIIDTLGSLLNSTVLVEDHFTSMLEIALDGKLIFASNNYVNDQFDVYLTKLNQNLGQDSIYTMPFTYDSLCPYQIVSDTIVQDDCGLIVGVEEQGGEEVWEQGGMEAGRHGELVIWPNPARDIVDCRWSNFDGRGEVTLMIYDIFGRTILSLPRLGEGQGGDWRSWQVDVSSLPAGIYLAVVRDEKSFLSSAKFIVAR